MATNSMNEHYAFERGMGSSHRDAFRAALVHSTREGERAKREANPFDYDEVYARQAVIYTREDLLLLIADTNDLGKTARSIRRWLIAAVVCLICLTLNVLTR
jgi:hypothetical protein